MDALQAALAAATAEDSPDAIALMRILMEAPSSDAARDGLQWMADRCAAEGKAAASARLGRLQALWAHHPDAWRTVRAVAGTMSHERRHADPESTLRYLADTFDRLVDTSPEASVALYSLGSPELLAAATDEIVDRMDDWGLLGPDRDALDLGCGIGRFLQALAPRLRSVIGLDLSPRMVGEAEARCRGLPNVRVARGTGRDLAGISDATLDLVLAADVFPYLVQAGGNLPARHVAEFARVLRPGGAALILNYSYRGDQAADDRDIDGAASQSELRIERRGRADLQTWDGTTYLLRKPAVGERR
jgi:SAM-dependent methyltransferase